MVPYKYHFYPHLDEEPMSGADIEVLNVLSTPGRPVYFNHVGKTDLLQVKYGFVARIALSLSGETTVFCRPVHVI